MNIGSQFQLQSHNLLIKLQFYRVTTAGIDSICIRMAQMMAYTRRMHVVIWKLDHFKLIAHFCVLGTACCSVRSCMYQAPENMLIRSERSTNTNVVCPLLIVVQTVRHKLMISRILLR